MSGPIRPKSGPGRVLEAVRRGSIEPVVSWDLAEEIVAVLRRPRIRRSGISEDDVTDVLVLLSPFLPSIDVDVEVPIRDAGDAPVIAAAIAGRAEAIITGDRDLLEAPDFRTWLADRDIEVMTPVEALGRLAEGPT